MDDLTRAETTPERGVEGERRGSGDYGAHWGLTDLYPGFAATLRGQLESCKPFELSWGAKKAIRYATVKCERPAGDVCIEVRAYMDDGEELLDTMIWEAFGGNEFAESGTAALARAQKDPDSREALLDLLGELELVQNENVARASARVFCEASYEEVLEEIDACEEQAELKLRERYAAALEEVRAFYGLPSEACRKAG